MSTTKHTTTPEPAQAGPGPRILALDLSLTGTGYATNDAVGVIRTEPRRDLERLAYIRERVLELLLAQEPHVVAIEAPSYGSSKAGSSRGFHERGGLHYAILLAFHDGGVPVALIPPTNRAKYATGKGNAGKAAVVSAATYRAQRIFDDDNKADAWWLWQMAKAHYDPENALKLPKANMDGLAGCEWPDLTRRPT